MIMSTEFPEIGGTQDVFYGRPPAVPLPMMARAEGIRFWDEAGKEYIDASSGPMVSALGHCNPNVVAAMSRQALRLDYAYPQIARSRSNLDYAARLSAMAGPGFERVNFASGGSEAIDNALKFARQYALATNQASRRRIISLDPSYHGATIASLAAGGNDTLRPFFDGFAVMAQTIRAPVTYRLNPGETPESSAAASARELEDTIVALGPETVLAFLIEPVGGVSTGAVVPPAGFFTAIRDICTRHGVFLIFDEAICGAGRTGTFFAAHHWPDVRPDIIVQAKGLGAGYAPLAAMLVSATHADTLARLTGFNFSYSYNANPVSCAVGLAVLDEFDRLDLCANAIRRGAELRTGLEALKESCPLVGDVRGLGMLLAVELVADKATKAPLQQEFRALDRLRRHALDLGLLIYARETAGGRFGQWFMVAPPLVATHEDTDLILERIARLLDRVASDAVAARLL
ncbi:adenosylmethionine-8-amino-7-oxononanoate aminotransferase [Blastochloris viridis]|uniref:Adenosylmethionine-8-amino-7-oxononanoate aminotransferase n=2 Tax=Blastochloris viridis TaxID=1079 RepID=A0A182D1R7_BLAVI|nr:adenosylmethionine-8-amino-7-oxononanoate aminotransferase [Blastochloris viridis]